MDRTRLAVLALALGLAGASGCAYPLSSRLCSPCNECACNQAGAYGAIGEGMSGIDGPILMQPDGGLAPLPTPTGPPPRIVPVPQANPVPYTPTGLRRLFGREP
jgi:hypothetical protein